MAAPGSVTLFGAFGEHLARGTVDLDTDTIRAALVTSSYSPNVSTHDEWADASANEIANGNGYTTGGAALAGVSVSRSLGVTTFDANDTAWTATPGAIGPFRYLVLYAAVTRNGVTNPLIGYVLLDSAPADLTISASNTLTVQWNASGILTVTA